MVAMKYHFRRHGLCQKYTCPFFFFKCSLHSSRAHPDRYVYKFLDIYVCSCTSVSSTKLVATALCP